MKFMDVRNFVNILLLLYKKWEIICFRLPARFANRLITSISSGQIFHPHPQLGEQEACHDCALRLFLWEFTARYLVPFGRLETCVFYKPDINIVPYHKRVNSPNYNCARHLIQEACSVSSTDFKTNFLNLHYIKLYLNNYDQIWYQFFMIPIWISKIDRLIFFFIFTARHNRMNQTELTK